MLLGILLTILVIILVVVAYVGGMFVMAYGLADSHADVLTNGKKAKANHIAAVTNFDNVVHKLAIKNYRINLSERGGLDGEV